MLTALEKDPHKRFATVKAFAVALEQAAELSSPPNLPAWGALPGESAIITVITPARQDPPQANSITFPDQPLPLGAMSIPPVQSAPMVLPATSGEGVAPPGNSISYRTACAPSQQQISSPGHHSIIILLLLGLTSMGLALLHTPSTTPRSTAHAAHTPTTAHTSPTETPTPTPTSIITPTSTPITTPTPTTPVGTYPNIAGNANGPIHNTPANMNATMSLTIQQNQGSITGQFTVALPLLGSGPFTGSINPGGNIQFIVQSGSTDSILCFFREWFSLIRA